MRITSEMNGDLKYSELDCFKCPVLPHGFWEKLFKLNGTNKIWRECFS
jgi:hypothetical protein